MSRAKSRRIIAGQEKTAHRQAMINRGVIPGT
jgi:hypothetical protein